MAKMVRTREVINGIFMRPTYVYIKNTRQKIGKFHDYRQVMHTS